MNNYCKNILNNIYNDDDLNNPIKEFIILFNKYWDKNINELKKTFNNFSSSLDKIYLNKDDNLIKNSQRKIYKWKNKINVEPYFYQEYNKKYNISYDKFYNLYNTKQTNDCELNYLDYININTSNNVIIDIINKLQNSFFTGLDIKLYIDNNINHCIYYSFDHLDLYFFYNPEYIKSSDFDIILSEIYVITKWIYQQKPIQKIKLSYFDIPLDKKLNVSNNFDYKYISFENVNSGLTHHNIEIIIWRREEIFKVLIHELIHFLDIDHKYEKNSINLQIGKIEYPILINETFTELHAQFIHTIYVNHKYYKYDFDMFKKIYLSDLIYSWYIFAKIINFFNIDEFNINNLIKKFNQSSNVFSYYILKCLFCLEFLNRSNITEFNIDHILKLFSHNFIDKVIRQLKINDLSLRMCIFGKF